MRETRGAFGAAPVITHEGVYGAPPPPYRPAERGTEARAWLTIAFAFVTMLWLATFSVAQITAREISIPASERAIAALSEVDSLLALGEQALCTQAGGDGTLDLPGFAVGDVEVRANEVRCTTDGRLDIEALRALLLERGADLVYLRGVEAFIEAGRSPEPTSALSGAGALRGLLDTLTAAVHEPAALLAWVLGGLGAALAGALLTFGRAGRLTRVAVGLVVGAIPVLVAALALRFALGAMSGGADDPMLQELIAIARTLTDVPFRDALFVLLGGFALVLPSFARRFRR